MKELDIEVKLDNEKDNYHVKYIDIPVLKSVEIDPKTFLEKTEQLVKSETKSNLKLTIFEKIKLMTIFSNSDK